MIISKLTAEIIKAGAKLNPRTLELAIVESLNPFKIKVGSLPVGKENLLVSYHLIKYSRKISFNSAAGGEVIVGTTGNIESIEINNKDMDFQNILKVGDTLVVQEIENGQRYIVIDKVVTL